MSDRAQPDSSVAVHHSTRSVVLHDLILHQGQLLSHLPGLLLMPKHTLAHLIDDQLATIDILFGPSQFVLEPLNLTLLLVLVRLDLVLLLY